MPDPHWQEHAACRDCPEEMTGPIDKKTARRLIAWYCRACPVVAQCEAHADRLGETDGVWGGKHRKGAA